MERFYSEPESERLQWMALAVLDDWGGELVRSAVAALLQQHGIETKCSWSEEHDHNIEALHAMVTRSK